MARKARERYVVKHSRYFVNGHNMEGVEVILLGPCSSSGKTKTPAGKKLLKSDSTHYLLRFSDKKILRRLGLPAASLDFPVSQKDFPIYFELVTD